MRCKKKHHHVWADYLRRWSHDGVKVYHTTLKRNIINESVRGVAMEQHFYRLTSLSDFDVSVILNFSGKADSELQKLHKSYLADFLKFQKTQQIYEASGRPDSTTDRAIKALESKLMENLHSAHEREVSPILRALADGQLSVLYENKNILAFTTFLGHQITRTKNMKDKVFANPDNSVPGMRELSASMKNSWWFLSYMLGMNLGRELYLFRDRYTHTLLRNNSGVPFITSDQPVINVHDTVWKDEKGAPESVDFYYPISPSFAYLIAESKNFKGGVSDVCETEALGFNKKIAARANTHIVGVSEESLRPLLSLIGLDRLPQ
ncbi:hypothetical protein AL050_18680 [Pseudomonas syringae pv. daphniphylli]|nr:hypothetical protein AL050_18680 [Pseudomonas syringae pv. daphniphylli]